MKTQDLEMAVLCGIITWGYDKKREQALSLSEDDFPTEALGIFYSILRKHDFDANVYLAHFDADDNRLFEVITQRHPTTINAFDVELEQLKKIASSVRIKKELAGFTLADNVVITTDDLQMIVDLEHKRDMRHAHDTAYLDEYSAGLTIQPQRIKTGFRYLDSLIMGFEVPSMTIIGARPSTGKTSFALNIALKVVKQNKRVLIFSLEMTRSQIIDRIISMSKEVRYENIVGRTLSGEELQKCKEMVNWLKKGSIIIIDDVYTVENMAAVVRKTKPDMVIVDFMQITDTVMKFNTTREKINYISSKFKRMAKDNGCCMLVLSQLNRNDKDRPTMSDLRESGALEADGDYVMLMHRPYVLDKGGEARPEETYVLVDKNKYGKCDSVEFVFDGAHQKFSEVEKRYDK